MAQGKLQFTVPHPCQKVLAFLSDPGRVGECLAFVQGVEKESAELRWRVKSPMAGITQSPFFELDFQVETDGVHWHGKGRRLETRGKLVLSAKEAGTTAVDFTLEMVGLGAMALVIDPLAAVQIDSQIGYFASQLRDQLGGAQDG
jgi:carbon monoxide dehydrogenase subunit G